MSANIIMFPGVRDDADDHQLALVTVCDEARVLLLLADAIERYTGPILANAVRATADTIHKSAWRALEAGERFEQHHKDMNEALRQARKSS